MEGRMTTFAQPAHYGGNKDIERDQWGRPLVAPPDSNKKVGYTRCTTFVHALSDTSNLEKWKLRLAAKRLADDPELTAQIKATDPDDKPALNALVDMALNRGGATKSADLGTAMHEACEAHDKGELAVVPDGHEPDLAAYITATQNLTWSDYEQFRVHDGLQIGGTADRIGIHPDGYSFIADIKTGGLYDVGKMAMQMAVYAHSVPYNPHTGQRGQDTPPMNTDIGLLIHLPAGEARCDLYWLNLTAGWEAVQLAKRVREWRSFHTRKATRDQIMQKAQF